MQIERKNEKRKKLHGDAPRKKKKKRQDESGKRA